MAKRIIQVPVEESLLSALNSVSRQRGQRRSEVIREACRQYLRRTESQQMDETYVGGYSRMPEEPAIGEAQAAIAGHVLSQESW